MLADPPVTFRYPFYLRWLLRAGVSLFLGLICCSAIIGRWEHASLVSALCLAAASVWWFALRRDGLAVGVDERGIRFIRGRANDFAEWPAIQTVQFSTGGVVIKAYGKDWFIGSSLLGWDSFQQAISKRASFEALAGWLSPPFTAGTRWTASFGIFQQLVSTVALLIGAVGSANSGQWMNALILLGISALFFYLWRNTVIFYRFRADGLVIQRLAKKETWPWSRLEFAALREKALLMFFGRRVVAISQDQISRSIEEVFTSMREFWNKEPLSPVFGKTDDEVKWSWPAAFFWWSIVPILGMVAFPIVMNRIRFRLGHWVPVCDNMPTPAGPCTDLYRAGLFLRLDVVLIALMLILVLAIALASVYSNRNRENLIAVFRPTVIATLVGAFAVMLLQSLLFSGLLWSVPLEFGEKPFYQLILVGGLGLAFGLFHLARNSLIAFRKLSIDVDAVSISPDDEPDVWRLASETARRLGAPAPDNILLGLEPNFFVTEAIVGLKEAKLSGHTLYLCLPAARFLGCGELRAILGHEFGHFRNDDTRLGRRFSPLYNSALRALVAMAHSPASWILLPALYLLEFLIFRFGKVQSALSRDCEFLADKAAVEASSAKDHAAALVKLEVFGPEINGLVNERVYARYDLPAISECVQRKLPEKMPAFLAHAFTADPFDSHPPLEQRLANLQVSLDEAWHSVGEPDAIGLFRNPEEIERRALTLLRDKAQLSPEDLRYTYVRRPCPVSEDSACSKVPS